MWLLKAACKVDSCVQVIPSTFLETTTISTLANIEEISAEPSCLEQVKYHTILPTQKHCRK
jgi:hypothetical protein